MTSSSPRRHRRDGARARFGLALGSAALVAVPAVEADASAAHPADRVALDSTADRDLLDTASLVLAEFDFTLSPGEPFTMTVRLPDSVTATDLNELADYQLRIRDHEPITDRTELWAAHDGDLPDIVDTVVVPLDPVEPVPALAGVDGQFVSVSVPRVATDTTTDVLEFAEPGLRPVTVELRRDNRTVDAFVTDVNVLAPGRTVAGPAMQVALVMTQRTPPAIDTTVQPGSATTVTVDATARDELADIASVVESLGSAVQTSGGTARPAVRLQPETLHAVARSDRALADRLTAALLDAEVITAPRLPFDASLAVATDHRDALVRLLREGETLLGTLLPGAPLDRTVEPLLAAPTPAGAGAIRDLGGRLFVMSYPVYDTLPGSLRFYTDTTQLIDLDLGDGTTVPAAISDERLSELLVDGGRDPLGAAVRVMAELVAIGADVERVGGVVERHGMVLTTPDLGVPDPQLVALLAPMLTTTPGIRLVTPRDFASSVDVMLVDGRQVTVGLPVTTDATAVDVVADMEARTAELDAVSTEIFAVSSMLADGSSDIASWVGMVESLASPVFDADDVQTSIGALRAEFRRIRECVVAPAPFGFTLTGRNSTMRFGITNTCTVPITVAVLLDAAKIEFPDGAELVTLAPAGDTTVEVRARARSNGMSSTFLRLYTPADAATAIDDRTPTITPQVVLTARVTSFAGLGQLLGGAGLLILLSWWFRHVRDARRTRAVRTTSRHHPATRASADVDGERTSLHGP